ncbi:MAG: hypothetical protein AB1458_16470 [Bacteroidota bacterium]
MNKELYDSFKKMGETARAEMRFRLKDSPVGLLLYDYLDKCTNRNFRNRDVVESIYKSELQTTPYAVLENRFFKLRKKFLEEYTSGSGPAADQLADQEKKLLHCRQLLGNNEKESAYQQLGALEKECWDKNIFELLPQVIDQMIFCNQSLNRLNRNDSLYPCLEKAIGLQADMNRANLLARKIYEINFREGLRYAKKELAEIKELADRNRDYPRFIMCYHHISLYYKLGSADYVNDMQVISRHFTQFKKLNEQYPLMPLLSYKANYNLYQHMHFSQISVFYHFNRCEFEEAYQAMKKMWDMVHGGLDIYRMYKAESVYFNMLSAQRAAGRYTEADKTIDDYIAFLKENGQPARMPYAYTQKAIVYCEAFPRTFGLAPAFLQGKLDEYIRSLRGNNNVLTSVAEALLTKAKLYFLEKDSARALKMLERPEVIGAFEPTGLYKLFKELFSGSVPRPELKKKIARKRYVTRTPNELLHLRWMDKAAGL